MNSDIVVISWWSNCLGLRCLSNLCDYAPDRRVFVIQVGKQEYLKEAFRNYMPEKVVELSLPRKHLEEHWAVCEWVVRKKLNRHEGLWFFDHDFFIEENGEGWLKMMDEAFAAQKTALAYPVKKEGLSITNPAFWIDPKRLPEDAPGFSPIPALAGFRSRKPYAPRKPMKQLRTPEKDTMVACKEYLAQLGLATRFVLYEKENGFTPVPAFSHLGGLYFFTYLDIPPVLFPRTRKLVKEIKAFFNSCPSEWLEIEDPALLRRIAEFDQKIPVRPV